MNLLQTLKKAASGADHRTWICACDPDRFRTADAAMQHSGWSDSALY
mgnify:CR=1 FL=1